jgi:hypothetical protein
MYITFCHIQRVQKVFLQRKSVGFIVRSDIEYCAAGAAAAAAAPPLWQLGRSVQSAHES